MLHGDEVLGGVTHSTNGFLAELDELREPAELLAPDEWWARLEASGLTGMGGAGFPTKRKWDAVRREPTSRVVVVNADEGEPGTISDRYVMELRPQLLLEGLAAAMRFRETDEAYIYLREEYATSRAVLQEAIAVCVFLVRLVIGAGAYICGEETAMLESMEGRRGCRAYGRRSRPSPATSAGRRADQQRRDAGARRADTPRRGAADASGGRSPRRGEARLLRGPARRHPRSLDDHAGGLTAEVRADVLGGAAGILLAGRSRHAADARGARGVGLRRWNRRRSRFS